MSTSIYFSFLLKLIESETSNVFCEIIWKIICVLFCWTELFSGNSSLACSFFSILSSSPLKYRFSWALIQQKSLAVLVDAM